MPSKVNQVDWSLVVPGTSSCKFGLSYSGLPPSYSIAKKQENHSCTLASLSNGHYLSSPPPPTCLHTILLLLLLLLLLLPLLSSPSPPNTGLSRSYAAYQ
ncbi:hypothetical protein OIU76_000786 [Salix suchowensis]|nr:hypothetical protein OIU76_000786 [Salix suchowensis]